MEIKYVHTRKRREFGAPCRFTDVGPNIIVDIRPDPELEEDYVKMDKLEQDTQCANFYSFHEINTDTAPTESRGIDHVEGGWPADVDYKDDEQVARFRKKVEKEEAYPSIIKNLGDTTEKLIMENNAVGIYQYYFDGEDVSEEDVSANFDVICVQRDYDLVPGKPKRRVSAISWSLDGKNVAVAYTPGKMSDCSKCSTDSYVWDITNTIEPVSVLKSSSLVTCMTYSESSPVLVCGLQSGQVGVFDLSTRSEEENSEITSSDEIEEPTLKLSDVHESHLASVSDITWLHSKCGSEFISAGHDGRVLSWDTRNMTKPTRVFVLESIIGDKKESNIITCLEFDPTSPNQFMVATDNGIVFKCNRRAEPKNCIVARFPCEPGTPILAMERNAFTTKIFIVASAWSIQLWNEDHVTAPLMTLKTSDGYIVDVKWFPTRPSAIIATKSTGFIEMWDILVKVDTPVHSQKLSVESLTSVKFWDGDGPLLACGSVNGYLFVLQGPKSSKVTTKTEKSRLTGMFERDSKMASLLELEPRDVRIKVVEADRRLEEEELLKALEIPPTWVQEDPGKELYDEVTAMEIESGFPSEEELEEDMRLLCEKLEIEEETGESEFLEALSRRIQVEDTMEDTIVETEEIREAEELEIKTGTTETVSLILEEIPEEFSVEEEEGPEEEPEEIKVEEVKPPPGRRRR